VLSSLIKSPWQKYAAPVNAMSVGDALKQAGLDWDVSQSSVFFEDERGERHPLPGRIVNWRRNANDKAEVLGVVSPTYSIVQNSEAFGLLNTALYGANANFTAGGVAGGRSFLQAHIPDGAIEIDRNGDKDVINRYILVSTSHDGTSALKIAETPIRVRCLNTLLMAEHSKDSISIRHTGDTAKEVALVRETMEMGYRRIGELKDVLQIMAHTPITEEMFINYITAVYPLVIDRAVDDKKRNVGKVAFEQMAQAFLQGMGNRGESFYDAYNAVTEYVDHRRGVSPDRWVEYTAFGHGATMKRTALQLATDAVGIGSYASMGTFLKDEADTAIETLIRSRN